MSGETGPIRLKSLKEPVNMSKNGQCSRCGQCCPSIICVSEQELTRLRGLANNIKPIVNLDDTTYPAVYARCPFLVQRKYFPAYCQIYDNRPRVCRTFDCWHSNRENAERYIDAGGETEPAVNLWTLFGLTGIYDENGRQIPARNPYHIDARLSGHREVRLQVGQPVTLWTYSGRYVQPSLIVGMSKKGIQIFNNGINQLETISFNDIESLDVPENAIKVRSKKPKKKKK